MESSEPSYGAISSPHRLRTSSSSSFSGAAASPNSSVHSEHSQPNSFREKRERGFHLSSGVIRTILIVLALIVGVGLVFFNQGLVQQPNTSSASTSTYINPAFLRSSAWNNQNLPMPDGVNVGSWLSLEDWFFSGAGSVEVATPDDKVAAVCLPPLHTGVATGPTWHSETDLLQNLTNVSTLGHALRVFHAHRTSFLDLEGDLGTLSQLGVKSLRVPLSWCLTDADPADIDPRETDIAMLEEKFTCRDPFYEGVLWPAVPRRLIVRLLEACGVYGIRATLDMHTYPGATSPGTFSGLWPRWPRFWTHGDQPATDYGNVTDIGRQLWSDMVEWVEGLDHHALKGLEALSPMNEPAHLAGAFFNGRGSDPPYLPPLPKEKAQAYLEKLASKKLPPALDPSKLTQVPDGPHLRVFSWLDDAIDRFRNSALPLRGIRLAVNVHESVLMSSVLPENDAADDGGRHPGGMKVIAAWWRGVTKSSERARWAWLDIHHYHAWEGPCLGASDGHIIANYSCSMVDERNNALNRCAGWASLYRDIVDAECGPGAHLMSGEMSVSTHHSVRHACNDWSTLRASYLAQLQAARKADVRLYWWSYKMPYGGSFRPAWSFRHFLYLMDVLPRADQTSFPCGDHIPTAAEPVDEFFH